jgi:hypothetical protein
MELDNTEKRRRIYIGLIILVVIVLAAAVYFTFSFVPACQNFECFQGKMVECSKGSYVNEDPDATWIYTINGKSGDNCIINVKLLMAKKGEIGIDKLIGEDMTCYYPVGLSAYPEKDLTKCHGLLKEDLQGIVINKLHAYILENFGKFEESLKKAI